MNYKDIVVEVSKNEYITLKNSAKDIKQKLDRNLRAAQNKKKTVKNIKKNNSANIQNELEQSISLLHSFYMENVKTNEKHIGSFLDVLKFSLLLYKNINNMNNNIFELVQEKRELENKLYKYNKPHMSVFSTKQEFLDFKTKKEELTTKLDNLNSEINEVLKTLGGEMFNTYSTFLNSGNIVDFKTNIIRLSYIINTLKSTNFKVDYSNVLKDKYFEGEYSKIIKGLDPKFNIDDLKDKSDLEKINIILENLFTETSNILNVISVIIFAKGIYDLKMDEKFININGDNIIYLNKEFRKSFMEIKNKLKISNKTLNNQHDTLVALDYIGNYGQSKIEPNYKYENINNYKYQSAFLDLQMDDNYINLKIPKGAFADLYKALEFVEKIKNIENVESVSKLRILNNLTNVEKGKSKLDVHNINSIMFINDGGIPDEINQRYDFISNLDIKLTYDKIEKIDEIIKNIIVEENSDTMLEFLNMLLHFEKNDIIEKALNSIKIDNSKIQLKEKVLNSLETVNYLNILSKKIYNLDIDLIKKVMKTYISHSEYVKERIISEFNTISTINTIVLLELYLLELIDKLNNNKSKSSMGDEYIKLTNKVNTFKELLKSVLDDIESLTGDSNV